MLEREDLVVLAHHIDGAVGDAGGSAQRPPGTNLPGDPAVPDVERGDIAEAVGRVDPAGVIGDPAAVQRGLVAADDGGLARPDLAPRAGIERADRAERVDRIDPPASDDRSGGEARRQAAPASRLDAEGLAEGLAEREMAHRLGRVAARLRPFGVGDLGGQRHRQRRRRRIDLDVAFGRQHRDPLAEHRRLRLRLVDQATSARGERSGNENGKA